MVADRNIKVDIEVKNFLDVNKKVKEESYNSVLKRILKIGVKKSITP